MNRRELMLSASALAAAATLLPRNAFADPNRIDWYTDSDQNILDFWTNIVKPKFEAANPGITLNLVDAGDAAGAQAIAERALAAMQTNTDPRADYFETWDPRLPKGAIDKGLWVDMKTAGLSNYSKVNPLAFNSDFSLPYRGSQVLLAYDTAKLKPENVPKTWADLVAWIKANPGQFIYNRPDKGGAGGNFVRRAIWEVNGRDPKKFTIDNAGSFAATALPPAWDLLNELAPYMMDKGAYTSGNTQSIQLLSQSAVTMIPAWSDQSLQAISTGVLPETTGLVQLTDLALAGDFSRATVFANGVNKAAALKLADFVLSEEIQSAVITQLGGFPGVSWDYVSKELHDKYKDVIPASIPVFPGGDWEKAINDGWYRAVAPNIDRSK
ncbi:MAG TPA: extracellular solute-binding protein [Devosia sp.]|nr:extracellular solute-binding protein [Devosia sp.]